MVSRSADVMRVISPSRHALQMAKSIISAIGMVWRGFALQWCSAAQVCVDLTFFLLYL